MQTNHQITQLQRPGKFLWVGIGCQRGTSSQLLAKAIGQVCKEYLLDESAIAGIATIDTKISEPGLAELCHLHHWLLKTFPAATLRTVLVPNPNETITQFVGTSSVAEAAAMLASAGTTKANLGVLLVPKQIVVSVTVAIAQINQLLSENS